MFKVVKNRLYFYIFSIFIVVLSFLAIFIWKLNISIDFKGGSIIEISAPDLAKSADEVKESSLSVGLEIQSASSSGNDKLVIRTKNLSPEEHTKLIENLKVSVNQSIVEDNFQTIGPVVSQDLTRKAIWAVVIASIAIIFYIAYAFRKLPKSASSWHFGVTAVIALIHDLIVTTGFVALIGHFYSWMQVDSLFITALLTIMGFSVHDTIVVFDRIRENLVRHPGADLETLSNDSILQTISRSINTSLTTILVLLALFLLGGESIKHFVLTLIIGITFGTYSSIFIATMLLVSWNNLTNKKLEN
jgi:preprotein translocase subunit SecF